MIKNDYQPEWKLAYPLNPIYNKPTIFDYLNIDFIIICSLFLLFSIAMLSLYSAIPKFIIVKKQLIHILIATIIMLFTAQIPPRVFKFFAPWLYLITLLLLIIVISFGYITNGAQRWIDLKFFRFQPAEIMKIALPLMLARYLDKRILPLSFIQLFTPCFLIALPSFLIFLQPDLGTAILVASSGLLVVYFSGIKFKHIFFTIVGFLSSIPILWLYLHDYQRQRIKTLLNPNSDPLNSGYHIIQSKIAIGSGGLYGKGWLQGTQSKLDFLPEKSTDFIFSVFSEEFGLVGIMILFSLYALLIIQGMLISLKAKDTFTRLLASSLSVNLFVYVFVNVGMVCGILPVVGVPLPFISYGGTSLVTVMLSFGIIMSIKSHNSAIINK